MYPQGAGKSLRSGKPAGGENVLAPEPNSAQVGRTCSTYVVDVHAPRPEAGCHRQAFIICLTNVSAYLKGGRAITDSRMQETRRRGRPRIPRRIDNEAALRCYAPQCQGEAADADECVVLLPEELELLRLVDLNGLEQEEAGASIGVSRRTVWKDLHEARRKVADALINGKKIEIAGCERRLEGRCPREGAPCLGSQDGFCRRRKLQRNQENK